MHSNVLRSPSATWARRCVTLVIYLLCSAALSSEHSWHTGVLPKQRHMLSPPGGGSGSNSLTNASRGSGTPAGEEELVRRHPLVPCHFSNEHQSCLRQHANPQRLPSDNLLTGLSLFGLLFERQTWPPLKASPPQCSAFFSTLSGVATPDVVHSLNSLNPKPLPGPPRRRSRRRRRWRTCAPASAPA